MTVGITVGTRFPAHATSLGLVLLAALEPAELDAWLDAHPLTGLTDSTVTDPSALRASLRQVAEQGWASSDQQLAPGLRSIAAEVRDRRGVVAAVNVSSTAAHDPVREYLEPLRHAAAAITGDLSAGP